jgi:hypothetical protein
MTKWFSQLEAQIYFKNKLMILISYLWMHLESSAMDKVTLIIFWASTILAVLLLVLVALCVLWKRKSGRKIGKYSTTSVLDKHFFFLILVAFLLSDE